ncbi:MAG: ABC transporter ATP-binding protein [Syntrophobacterales bacterium]|jgi:tungstate transport system ATP-binding protein|nr:ABC transporter ATP-binding protein [Syntrophobacterales bacterium]
MGNREIILDARGLHVERAGLTVLDVPSLQVFSGEVLTFIGPNGAGKSTLLMALCALQRPREGSIFFRGAEVDRELSFAAYRKQVTMVFQEPLLFNTTVFRNVVAGLRFRGVKGREADKAATDALDLFGIGHLKDRSAKKISGGEAQRVSLARAFAIRPDILALDEPFSALDPPTREALVEDLKAVLRQSGTTALCVTHDRTEALQLSRRIAVMNRGRIVQIDSPENVMNHPVDPFVATFVGVETILPGTVLTREEGVFTAAVGDRRIEAIGEVTTGEKVFLFVRPEDVTIRTDSSGAPTSARNTFPGTIEKIIAFGPYQKVSMDCGFPVTAYITKSSIEGLKLKEGSSVLTSFKATAVHVVKTSR